MSNSEIKECPYCAEVINVNAIKCKHCKTLLDQERLPLDNDLPVINQTTLGIKDKKSSVYRKIKPVQAISIIIGIIVIAIFAMAYYNNQKELEATQLYAENIDAITFEMLQSAAEAEIVLNLTARVWFNSIYKEEDFETDRFTRKDGKWVEDFNDALSNLFADSDFLYEVSSIEYSQTQVEALMKSLQGPPKEYERTYETLLDLYAAYQGLVELAINPKGNLNSFSSNKEEKLDKFLDIYRRLEMQLPN